MYRFAFHAIPSRRTHSKAAIHGAFLFLRFFEKASFEETIRVCSKKSESSPERHCVKREPLHVDVDGAFAAFGWDPGDDLVRVGDVARFAVHAVREVDDEFAGNAAVRFLEDRFIHFRRAEILAWIAVFDCALVAANVRVLYF